MSRPFYQGRLARRMKLSETILEGRSFEGCPVKGCTRPATEQHHILYEYHDGGPVTKALCQEHYSWITRRQSHASKRRYALTEKQRWYFWFELIEGRMKRPRQTRLDSEWSGDTIRFGR